MYWVIGCIKGKSDAKNVLIMRHTGSSHHVWQTAEKKIKMAKI